MTCLVHKFRINHLFPHLLTEEGSRQASGVVVSQGPAPPGQGRPQNGDTEVLRDPLRVPDHGGRPSLPGYGRTPVVRVEHRRQEGLLHLTLVSVVSAMGPTVRVVMRRLRCWGTTPRDGHGLGGTVTPTVGVLPGPPPRPSTHPSPTERPDGDKVRSTKPADTRLGG